MRNIVCMVLSVILLGVLVVMYADHTKEQQEKQEILTNYVKETSVYRKQIEAIEAEMAEKAKEVSVEVKKGKINLAVKAANTEELLQAVALLGEQAKKLTVVVDVSIEEEELDKMLEEIAQHKDWAIMLTGTEEWISQTASVKAKLEGLQLADTGFAYFKEQKLTEAQLAGLAGNDWQGYSVSLGSMAEKTSVKIEKQAPSKIGHVVLAEENALLAVILDSCASGDLFIMSVEMERLHQSFDEKTIERVLGSIKKDYLDKGILEQVSIEEYIAGFEAEKKENARKQQEYEAYVAKKQAEIAALEEKIALIRSSINWTASEN